MKPTYAEIKFFIHPDQAWLQKYWKPAVGDWVHWVDRADLEKWSTDEAVMVLDEDDIEDGVENFGGDVTWLPTLSDLVNLIEQKKRSWSIQCYFEMGTYPAEDMLYYDGLIWQVDSVIEYETDTNSWMLSSPVIAAAKLLEQLKDV